MAEKRKRQTVKKTIERFLKNTTLHGFKYLCSEYRVDVVGWLFCGLASACCAGVLCVVLWERFQQIPALLALRDLQSPKQPFAHRMPVVAVCPPVESIAELFVDKLTTDKTLAKRLPLHLARILEGKKIDSDQLTMVDGLLTENNLSLAELMYMHMPPCQQLVRKCRWQRRMVRCDSIFEKMMTSWGICCVMQPEKKLNYSSRHMYGNSHSTRTLDLALQCTNKNGSILYGCEFVTKYNGQEYAEPTLLTPGYNYIAQLTFSSIIENGAAEKLVEQTCASTKDYTSSTCLEDCAEKVCGCKDPMSQFEISLNDNSLPDCNISQLPCLRSKGFKNNLFCNCLPPCKKVTTAVTYESSPMDYVQYTYDPIYTGLNITRSIVIHFRVNIGLSTSFTINPTETWLTLLSSLGGVFNMFLGVGLFSALEILYLIFVQLPKAIQRPAKINQPKRNTRY